MLPLISSISSLLALCGISSLRNFTPAFCFALGKRFLTGWAHCPEPMRAMFDRVPDWVSCDVSLVVLGLLAFWELLANWNDTARELLDELQWDKYFKPVFAFAATYILVLPDHAGALEMLGIADGGASAQTASAALAAAPMALPALAAGAAETVQAVQSAQVVESSGSTDIWSFSAALISIVAACITFVLASIRSKTAAFLRDIDPDNSLYLHTIATFVEESTWVSLAACAVLLPLLAGLLLLVGLLLAAAAKRIGNWIVDWRLREPKNMKDPGVEAKYRQKLIWFHRCPDCRVALGHGHVCPKCHNEPWSEAYSKRSFVAALDGRCYIIYVITVLLSLLPIPFVSYIFGSVALSFAVMQPIRRYSGMKEKILSSFLRRILRFCVQVVALILSFFPYVGAFLLIPKTLMYVFLRRKFLRESQAAP